MMRRTLAALYRVWDVVAKPPTLPAELVTTQGRQLMFRGSGCVRPKGSVLMMISRSDAHIQFRYCSTTSPVSLPKDARLQKLKDAFNKRDSKNWEFFTTEFKRWEESLRPSSEDTMTAGLQQPPLSFSAIEAAEMSAALVVYFKEMTFVDMQSEKLGKRITNNGYLMKILNEHKISRLVSTEAEDPVVQVKKHITDLVSLMGNRYEKSEVKNLATSGMGGSGKTELLKVLQQLLDTLNNGNAINQGDAMSDCKNDKFDGFQHFAVMFAPFSQGSNTLFDPRLDTLDTIEARLVHRLANDYFGTEYASGWPQTLKDFLHQFRSMIASREHGVAANRIGVLICIDSLMRIRRPEIRKALLNCIAATQQQQLEDGLPTFCLVSSLQLWACCETWIVEGRRSVGVIELPILPADSLIELCKQMRTTQDDETEKWHHYVETRLELTGGHPRDMEGVVEDLYRVSADASASWTFPTKQPTLMTCAETSTSLWNTSMAHQILHGQRQLSAQHSEKGDCQYFADHHVITVEPLWVESAICPDELKVRIRTIPALFLMYGSTVRGENVPFCPSWARLLENALLQLSNNASYKACELGMNAAIALRAQAYLTVEEKNPTLGELFPSATFTKDSIKEWTLPIDVCRDFVGCNSENAKDLLDWPDDPNTTVLHRYSTVRNCAAVEGSLELRDANGKRIVGWIQNKLYAEMKPGDVETWVKNIVTFHEDAFPNVPMCVILLCSGDARECFEDVSTRLVDTECIFVGTTSCHEILRPFGASVLLKKLKRRTRDSTAEEAGGHQKGSLLSD